MNQADRVLYHQVHPAKLAADIGSTVVAIPLLWTGDLWLGLAVALGVPIVASAIVLRSSAVEQIARRPIAAYLRRSMTPPMQAIRLVLGLAVLAGAWWHWPALSGGSIVGVALVWANGLVRR